jgi:hypothetical protein
MKTKNCTVKLVEYTSEKIENLIKQIEVVFDNVNNSTIKKIEWPKSDDGEAFYDFRTSVSFTCSGTKNDIYELMNKIKPNPITFN